VRRLLILLAAVTLLAAGCGGGGSGGSTTPPSAKPLTKAAYQAKLASTAKEIGQQLGGPKNQDFSKMTAKDVQAFVDAMHAFTAKLGQITPPAEVAGLHRQLIAALNDFADEFPGIAEKLKATKDPSTAIAALFGAKGIQELVKLGNEFKKKGYNLNLNG